MHAPRPLDGYGKTGKTGYGKTAMDEQELAHEREAPEREANPEKRRKLFAGASTTT